MDRRVTSFALIVGIILLSVVLDVVQQARAENTVDALRRSIGLEAEVLRNGTIEEVAVDQLVPGDIIELKAGDIVPGDCGCLLRVTCSSTRPCSQEKRTRRRKLVRACLSRRGAWASGELRLHGRLRDQRHSNGPNRSHRTRERTCGLAHGLAMERPRDAFGRGIRQFGFLMFRLTVFLVLFVTVTNVVFHRPLLGVDPVFASRDA